MNATYDTLIIGAGHNGLVCAAYLAKAGRKVLVLERRGLVGGACVTEEIAPGYRTSTASYVVSLLLPEIERDLRLTQFGYKVLPRSPSSFTPFADGRSLLMGPDAELNRSEIAKFSARDAEAYPKYEALLTRIAEHLEPALMDTPPDLLPLPAEWRRRGFMDRLRNLRRGSALYRAMKKLGPDLPEAIEILTGAATPVLDRWFESPELKGTLATDAIIGSFAPPSAAGSGYVLLHHVMGMAGGARGVWGYVEGGMGALTQAMARSAQASGVEIRCDAPVAEILVENGRACGVRLGNGEMIRARQVASNATAQVTFEHLVRADALPADFRRAVRRIDYSSAAVKINLAVSELPRFRCMPDRGGAVGPEHRGTIHINSMPEDLERAYEDARRGMPSQRPVIEMVIPSSVDTTLAPAGHHIVNLFVQYAPYTPTEAGWDSLRDVFADRCISQINEHAPNFAASVLHREVLAPPDLERRFNLTGGNIFQGAMPLHQLFSFRPVPGWGDYATPVPGLFLCGAAAHPGGGVMGACGRNAAQAMLRG
ncbi:phytoene dehydrogenase-like protein [Panacagrimonas perspica]|uniref:Pyridine nucleotide-disulfide oxidoreductase domain-containing protein 2 n=1 Tax=Panacagrimonas perspica TaxID=381431 RepID=A0A4R7NX53_9GAMM|nr:NAD(P)/FAD-dependent oxidoreductase [Panacagrimonas perspica]TDU25727.1 phytoene dehydrogenase-like protein [Panacagrimonas perspica]THD02885.1 amine oxidase [Panacagrimonas perspica]